MSWPLALLLNELMMLLTVVVVFPGFLPPRDGPEFVAVLGALFLLSFVWWLFLATAPFVFLFMWCMGDWRPRDHLEEWPWKWLHRTTRVQERRKARGGQ